MRQGRKVNNENGHFEPKRIPTEMILNKNLKIPGEVILYSVYNSLPRVLSQRQK